MALLASILAAPLGGSPPNPFDNPTGVTSVSTSDPFGTDIVLLPDLDPTFQLESGSAVVASALLRRLQTPRGGLFYDPEYGYDLRDRLNDSSANGFSIQSDVEDEIEKDSRVSNATVSTSLSSIGQLQVTASVTLSDGSTFDLIANAAQITVVALNAG